MTFENLTLSCNYLAPHNCEVVYFFIHAFLFPNCQRAIQSKVVCSVPCLDAVIILLFYLLSNYILKKFRYFVRLANF